MAEDSRITSNGQRPFSASEARATGFIPLPLDLARRIGPAAQTLGALLGAFRQDGPRTFRRQASLARAAGVDPRTFRRHLRELESEGVISTEATPGQPSTIRLLKRESEILGAYVPLPRYALDLPWSCRLVLGYVTFRAEVSEGGNNCGDGLREISRVLGMRLATVHEAVGRLADVGFLEIDQGGPSILRIIRPPGLVLRFCPDHPRKGVTVLSGLLKKSGFQEKESKKTINVVSKQTALLKIDRSELADDQAMGRRFRESIRGGHVKDTGADRLRFWGAAEHSLRVAKNPCALFVWLVKGGHWGHVSQADEDRGLDRLREFDRVQAPQAVVGDLVAGIGTLPEL